VRGGDETGWNVRVRGWPCGTRVDEGPLGGPDGRFEMREQEQENDDDEDEQEG
jgi:hypothetical protein